MEERDGEDQTWKRYGDSEGRGRETWRDTIDLPLNTSGIIEYDTVFN
jgi:hypothetical protein